MIDAKFRSIFDSRSNVTPEWREETKQKIEALSEISIINKIEDITKEIGRCNRAIRLWLAARDTSGLEWLVQHAVGGGFPNDLLDKLEERLSTIDFEWITKAFQRCERLQVAEEMLGDALYVKQNGFERPF